MKQVSQLMADRFKNHGKSKPLIMVDTLLVVDQFLVK